MPDVRLLQASATARSTGRRPVSRVHYLAMWGELQISPHPRGRYDSNEGSVSAMGDKRKWDKANPDKLAEIRERCSCQVGDHLCHQCQVDSRVDRWGICSEHCEQCHGIGFTPTTLQEVKGGKDT